MACNCNNSNCNGGCSPCPPCSPAIPETCEALGQTGTATAFVVEDDAFCKKTLPPPENPSLATQGEDGPALKDGSSSEKICLPALQKQVAGTINGFIGQDDDGCLFNSLPTSDANKYIPIGTGSGIVWSNVNDIFGEDGCGVLVRKCEPFTGENVYLEGEEGQVLSSDADGNPVWVDASTLTAVAGFIDAQAISANYSSGSSLIVNFGQMVVKSGTAAVVITNAVSYVLNLATVGAGGLDAGALAASTYYYIHVIYDKDNNVINVLASTSATAPVLPGTYDYSRVIGLFRTTGSAFVGAGYFQNGRQVFLGETAAPVTFTQAGPNSPLMYTGAVTGLAPYQYVNQVMFRMDAIGVTASYECNVIIADQVAGPTGASVSLPVTSNQYGSGNFTSTRTGLNAYATFMATVPYATPSYYNIYYAAAIPSGDSAALRILGYTLSMF
jgi:hypothetical protein